MGPMVIARRPISHGERKLSAAHRSRVRMDARVLLRARSGLGEGAEAAGPGGAPELRCFGRTTATSLSVIRFWDLSEGVGS
ncbi:hypothetical protein GALLR39Z86_22120 [Glycomyces algeriensis]|uniref:Uncharacterized protein n=1 Tax=Glycomyces algeriensis TaxID=256037 RepID=A0A9W6G8R5_9ACTN|nr:hypothetical protein GALLR39Z86_22120 [Glycomyces algeriensis]